MSLETMNVVFVGHVDHGKSTLIGRLLADTGVLGDGKVEKVQRICKQQGKTFEYAFLLDALEEEQGQGITIDSARVFFKSDKRNYIIIDAPGHIEFLKNMISGAARAEAAVLLIDANEGVQENSRRHGYLLSMLGIKQIAVAVNKIDLVDYKQETFNAIVAEYNEFLRGVGIEAQYFVPVSARNGDAVAARSDKLAWYTGPTILEAVDNFEKAAPNAEQPLRMPVQDVYKFNERGDDRRIIVGRVEAGTIKAGDKILFSPSNKAATVASLEVFSADTPAEVQAGMSASITLTEQLFISRGETISHMTESPLVSTMVRANLFWLGRKPMSPKRRYKLKLGTTETEVTIAEIHRILDASELESTMDKQHVERHDVADLTLRCRHPIAFDLSSDIEATGRFVIVDGYDIAGGGVIREFVPDAFHEQRLESKIRDLEWVRGNISAAERQELTGHPASLVMFTGDMGTGKHAVARALEAELVGRKHHAYLLDGKNVVLGVDADIALDNIDEVRRRFAEVAYVLLDAGNLVISTTNVIGLSDHMTIATRIHPFQMFVVHMGDTQGIPDGADMKFAANVDPAHAVGAIRDELDRRKLLTRR